MTKPKPPTSVDKVKPLPAIESMPGIPGRRAHGVASARYAQPASVECSCGVRLQAPSDAELALAFGQHVGDARVLRGLRRDGSTAPGYVQRRPDWAGAGSRVASE